MTHPVTLECVLKSFLLFLKLSFSLHLFTLLNSLKSSTLVHNIMKQSAKAGRGKQKSNVPSPTKKKKLNIYTKSSSDCFDAISTVTPSYKLLATISKWFLAMPVVTLATMAVIKVKRKAWYSRSKIEDLDNLYRQTIHFTITRISSSFWSNESSSLNFICLLICFSCMDTQWNVINSLVLVPFQGYSMWKQAQRLWSSILILNQVLTDLSSSDLI